YGCFFPAQMDAGFVSGQLHVWPRVRRKQRPVRIQQPELDLATRPAQSTRQLWFGGPGRASLVERKLRLGASAEVNTPWPRLELCFRWMAVCRYALREDWI